MQGNGIDRGLKTGERYGHFVFWVVTRYPEERFSDQTLDAMIRDEFPDRNLALGGRGTIQSITAYRSYTRNTRKRMGIGSDAEATEVLTRIDGKVKGPQGVSASLVEPQR